MKLLAITLALSLAPLAACEKKAASTEKAEGDEGAADPPQVQGADEGVSDDGAGDPADADYLSLEWARAAHDRSIEGAGDAEKHRKEGYALYKKKDDAGAIVAYEKAFAVHPSGETYYNYANSLSNVDRLPDSVKAYTIAIELGYARPEVALYNTACAYSRMENADGAYEFLQKAVAQGYSAWKKIEKDSDLKFLRAQADWKSRFSEIKGSSLGFDPEKLVGELSMMTERDDVRYTFCPSGKVFTDSPVGLDDDSCCGSRSWGRWMREGDAVIVKWNKICGQNGVGDPGEANALCSEYKKCSEKSCRPPKEDWEKSSQIAALVEMPKVFSGRKVADLEPDESTLAPFAGAVPKGCK